MSAHQGSPAGTRHGALRERDGEREQAVIARLSTLAPALDGEPDPDFRATARARLVAMAAVRTPGADAAPTRAPVRRRVWRRLTAGLATVAVVAAALTALIALASGSGPGDPLYGVKRGTERVQLALAGDSGPVLLHQAGTRLAEVRALAAQPSPDSALVVATLHTMDAQTTDAAAWFDARAVDRHSASPVAEFSRWASGQSSALTVLQARLPAATSAAVQHSLDLLAAARTRADAIRMTLTTAPRQPATSTSVTTGGNGSTPPSPGAPTSVGGSGSGVVPDAPVPSSGLVPSPGSGAVPPLPTPSAPTGIGGLPTLPVPRASLPQVTSPLPTLPAPSSTPVCIGPLGVGHC